VRSEDGSEDAARVSAAEPPPGPIRGGFVTIDRVTGAIGRILPFEYNAGELLHVTGRGAETSR
jgi:hypothetical protein